MADTADASRAPRPAERGPKPTTQPPASRDADDRRDVQASLAGDPEAYRRLVERHQQHVARLMWRFSRDRGTHEELVQDVFVEAYLSLATYRHKAPLAHWLARIATHVGYRYWKRQERQRQTETFRFENWDQVAQSDRDGPAVAEAGQVLFELLGGLPPRDRLVLTLRYVEQCSVEETAARTGWSVAMVKVQSHRARAKLKKLFQESGRELEL